MSNLDELSPGARWLYRILRDQVGEDGSVVLTSGELLGLTGWRNRATLRKRSHELENAGAITLEPTTLASGATGPNKYTITRTV